MNFETWRSAARAAARLLLLLLAIHIPHTSATELTMQQREGDTSALVQSLEQALDAGIPGLGLIVVDSAGVLELAVAGQRRVDTADVLLAGDAFHIGSVTKPLTATVIAQLVEEGLLRWDIRVGEVLPDVMAGASSAYQQVTLAHLLSHEAGLKPMEELEELREVPEFEGDIEARRRQFARWVFQLAPTVAPTEQYRYSNAHFVVAAAMAEAVTGHSWEALMQVRVFDRLGMSNAGFGWPGKKAASGPWGHRQDPSGFVPVDPNGDYSLPTYLAPAGDVHAALGDLGLFLSAYLSAWQRPDGLLAPDTVRKMFSRRLRAGLGWGATAAFGHDPVAMFSGSADTFLTIVVVVPDADIAVAVAANAFSADVEATLVSILRQAVQHYRTVPEPAAQ